MTEIIRMVAVLTIITGICTAALTTANTRLADRIDKQTDLYVRGPALERLFQQPASAVLANKVVLQFEEQSVPIFFLKEDRTISTLAIEATGPGGYGGDLQLLIGIDLKQDRLTGIEVISHSETPGLGARIEEADFRQQWQGIALATPLALTANGGTIDAITGASTTSEAAVKGTNIVLDYIAEHREKILTAIAQHQRSE